MAEATELTKVETAGTETVEYLRHVKPLLAARCFACHGALKQEGGLRLDTVAAMRRGGDSGPAVVARSTDASVLLTRIAATDAVERMPPEGQAAALKPDEIELIQKWIMAGATGPVDEKPEPDPREHWSFQPLRRPPLPPVRDVASNLNPIDRFITAKHEALGLTPVGPASPEMLLRRVYLDLIGLPPTRDELTDFLADPSPVAYEQTVDRLLARPEYGERWARHWMDVWRYSDWYGRRRENDVRNSYPHIWRWRDWIVRSLNDDKGYDRMLVEMLAADEVSPGNDDVTPALGFLARSWYSLNYDQWMRDMVEHTSKAFLGLRTNCALCHDHKYDPLSQREYFALRAFFEPLELRHDRVPDGPLFAKYERYKPGSGASLKPIAAGRVGIYDHYVDQPTRVYRGGDARDVVEGVPAVKPGVPAILGVPLPPIREVRLPSLAYYPGLYDWVRRAETARAADEIAAAERALDTARWSDERIDDVRTLKLRVAELALDLARLEQASTAARITADKALFQRIGDWIKTSEKAAKLDLQANLLTARHKAATKELAWVEARSRYSDSEPARPSVTAAEKVFRAADKEIAEAERKLREPIEEYRPLGPKYPEYSTGRRTALTAWLVDRRNPLPARVAVNHLWAWHFGEPIVATTHDLGRGGAEPTNRELLDWLAVELMAGDGRQGTGDGSQKTTSWSMKHLHRLIVTSRAYQRSSDIPSDAAANMAVDKSNLYLWHFNRRRMEAEVLRDGLLSVSGLLDATRGGPDIDNRFASTSRRRSLYFTRHPEGGGVMQLTAQFDPPDPTECYRRSETLVPQQALALTNGNLTLEAGRAIATNLLKEIDQDRLSNESSRERFVQLAFEQILNRSPRPAEMTTCVRFLAEQVRGYGEAVSNDEANRRAAESLARSLFSHHDWITIQ